MQEVRTSHNKDLRADPAWSINSGENESSCADLPGAPGASGLYQAALLSM